MSQQVTSYQLRTMLGLIATSAPMDSVHMHLFVNMPTLSPDMVPGDFTEPSAGGYAAQTIAPLFPNDPEYAQDGSVRLVADQTNWGVTGAGPYYTVQGWYITDDGDTNVLMAQYLDTPFNFGTEFDVLHLTPEYRVSPQSNYGSACQC